MRDHQAKYWLLLRVFKHNCVLSNSVNTNTTEDNWMEERHGGL